MTSSWRSAIIFFLRFIHDYILMSASSIVLKWHFIAVEWIFFTLLRTAQTYVQAGSPFSSSSKGTVVLEAPLSLSRLIFCFFSGIASIKLQRMQLRRRYINNIGNGLINPFIFVSLARWPLVFAEISLPVVGRRRWLTWPTSSVATLMSASTLLYTAWEWRTIPPFCFQHLWLLTRFFLKLSIPLSSGRTIIYQRCIFLFFHVLSYTYCFFFLIDRKVLLASRHSPP